LLAVILTRMAKDKQKKKQGAKNRTAQARISFLFQAAEYLSTQSESVEPATQREQTPEADHSNEPTERDSANLKSANEISGDLSVLRRHALPAYLASHMFVVRQKGQAKIDKDLKRRICKRCKCFLIEGKTSSTVVENKSRKSKPWADVTVVSCLACGMQKRYPVGIKKPPSKVSVGAEIGESD
jgi:ribonuclease P protein subunit RPR2